MHIVREREAETEREAKLDKHTDSKYYRKKEKKERKKKDGRKEERKLLEWKIMYIFITL